MNAVEGSDRVRPVGGEVRAPDREAGRRAGGRGRRRGEPRREPLRPEPAGDDPGQKVDVRMP